MKKKDYDREDSYNPEDEYVESEEYEDDSEYEEDEEEVADKPARPEKTLKVIFTGVIIACVVLGILIAVFFVIKNKKSDSELTTVSIETTTQKIVEAVAPEDKYTPGNYVVKIGSNATLNLRKEPESKKGNIVKKVRNGEKLVITEVFFDENAEEDKAYWGKTNYDGYDLWVQLNYLVKDYDNKNPSSTEPSLNDETTAKAEKPEKETSAKEPSTNEPASKEPATKEPASKEPATKEPVTLEKPTEEKTTVAGTSDFVGPSTPGEYTVNADEYLWFRTDHRVDSTAVLQVPKDTKLKITEVYHDKDSKNKYTVYWGKATYAGKTGWVAMGYLK